MKVLCTIGPCFSGPDECPLCYDGCAVNALPVLSSYGLVARTET